MQCFVSGATGFIGANLVHELIGRGHSVRALIRPGADRRALAGASFETISGDLSDLPKLRQGLRGCDWCFHGAASYHLWLPDYAPMYAANVDGSRNILTAARDAGCSRIVYTSTVGCIGLVAETDRRGADETHWPGPAQLSNHYKRSKWQAEQVARELSGQGAPIIIVNPSAPVGPRDVKPTPTGQVIVDFLNRRMPAFLDTGLNWVHVRDVATGHILAAERGKLGERYILGHRDGNWTLKETFQRLEQLTGIKAPKAQIPYWIAFAAAVVGESVSTITKRPPRAPIAGVRMARYRMFFDPTKAIRELGLPQTPPETAFKDAIDWFRANGLGGVRG